MKTVNKYKKKKQPKMIEIKPENIPNELKKMSQWVNWYWRWDEKKWTKPPCSTEGYDISHLKSNNTFEECLQAVKDNPDLGLGFSLRKEDKFCGIDYDDCVDKKGRHNKNLKKSLKLLKNTYSEYSPSGGGVRTLGVGNPKTRGSSKHSREIEIYNSGRYLTITGWKIEGTSKKLTDISKAVKKIDNKIYKRKKSNTSSSTCATGLEDNEMSNPKLLKLRELMFKFNPDNRDVWIKIGMAIHYETQGGSDGFQLWKGWSLTTTAKNFSEEFLEKSWHSFKKTGKKQKPTTIASLHYDVNEKEKQVAIEEQGSPILMSGKQLTRKKIAPVVNTLSPWLMKGSINMIHAKRGLGKTHMSLGIALAISNGGKFLKWNAPKKKKVLYVDGEMPLALLKEYLLVQEKATGLKASASHLSFLAIDEQKDGYLPSLSEEKGRDWIEKAINNIEPDVIIFDSLFTVFKINESDSGYWQEIQDWLIRLRSHGIDVILIHHDNKSGEAQNGKVDKEAVLNSIMHLKEPKGLDENTGSRFEVTYTKSRHFYGNDAMPFEARLEPDKNGVSKWIVMNANQTTRDKVVKYIKEGLTTKEVAEMLNISVTMINRHIKKCLEDGDLLETDINGRRRKKN